MSELKSELQKLYADASKHSVYQNVPDFVSAELGYTETIDENWRGDRPRLAYMVESRTPAAGESWLDFGANTGFFTLSLAHQFPQTTFVAVEANANHARFISRVAQYFGMSNVEVIHRAVGLADLHELPHSDCLLHLNVLHHAGHDFDAGLVPTTSEFDDYARRYFELLRERADAMFFQMGSNWGGDKRQPLVGVREDVQKLQVFSGWLRSAGWRVNDVAYAMRGADTRVHFEDLPASALRHLDGEGSMERAALQKELDRFQLDDFPGEFYRRPLFSCAA
ncbi:MAG TPA: class I SAM-dependent methyltransferase [Rhodanobacteraceae bacterium]|nr:class I SAM-dependent methyltransferase [Rhodanobacteraceae bacterium]